MITLCHFREYFRSSSSLFDFYGMEGIRYNQGFSTTIFFMVADGIISGNYQPYTYPYADIRDNSCIHRFHK